MIKLYVLKTFLLGLLLCSFETWAQTNVTGTVTSAEDNERLPGVSILEKGTTNGTVTNADGNYSITVGEDATLVFSFVGFATQEIPVAARTSIDLVLAQDVTALSEVVVIGYGEIQKKDATGAVMNIGARDFNRGVLTSPQDLIVGKFADSLGFIVLRIPRSYTSPKGSC